MAKSSGSAVTLQPETGPVPRGERRRQEIVAVAEQAFLAGGFADTTMQAVAALAGASKETLYRHFGSKEGLFAEIISNRARCLRGQLDADFDRPHLLGDVLRALGINLLEAMTSTEVVALMRIVVAESPRDPALGRIFYTLGPERTRTRLTDVLAAAKGRGEFTGHDPALAASLFIGATISQAHTARLVLSDPPPMSRTEIEERVDEVVAMFLARYAPPTPAV